MINRLLGENPDKHLIKTILADLKSKGIQYGYVKRGRADLIRRKTHKDITQIYFEIKSIEQYINASVSWQCSDREELNHFLISVKHKALKKWFINALSKKTGKEIQSFLEYDLLTLWKMNDKNS